MLSLKDRLKPHRPSVPDSPQHKRKKSEESLPDGFFKLKKPVGATLKRAKLEDTIYKDNFAVMNGWGKFYLPNTVNMQVVGVVDGISCPCDQLVLMTAHCSENRKVYAYDKKRLHCVALSIEELLKQGMEYPASESYYNGEAFKDMPSENWADTRTSSLGRRLDEEYKKMVASRKSSFLENLKHSTKQMLKSY